MQTSVTPSSATSPRSRALRPRSTGLPNAQSTTPPKRSRKKTTPGGPSSGKSDFATAAPPWTETAAPRTNTGAGTGRRTVALCTSAFGTSRAARRFPWAPAGVRGTLAAVGEEREWMSWDDLGTGSRALAEMIHADGFVSDIVLAVARGGLPVAGALAYALGVKNTFTMNVEL